MKSILRPLIPPASLDRLGLGRSASQHGVELGQLLLGGVVAEEAGGVLDLADHWKECTVPMMRRAEVAQPEVRLAGQPLQQRAGQSRFADASLTDQQHHPAFALLGLTPAAAQQLELLLAPDQRGQRDLVLRLKS